MAAPFSASAQLQSYLREVEQALRERNMARALQVADEAVVQGHEHSHLLVLAAHHRLGLGQSAKAHAFALRAREIAPRNVDVLDVLGLSLVRLGRLKEALSAFDAALRQSPAAIGIRFHRACAFEESRELKRARAEFERIIETEPGHVEARAQLVDLAVQRGDLEAARFHATHALKADPQNMAAQIGLARVDIAEGRTEDARVRLEPLANASNPSAINRSIAQGLVGDCLEGLGRIPEAFQSYARSQESLRAHYAPLYANAKETALARVRRLNDYFLSDGSGLWRNPHDGAECPVKTHVFLVGFPRSGTTLLEQVLASHPDVESMEERDCLVDAVSDFLTPSDGLDRLGGLEVAERVRYQKLYWERAREAGMPLRAALFLDKLPLNSELLCIVSQLFPRARILFALRDPRDVVLSCFRRRFVMTPQMFELTTLGGAATYYVEVMRLSETYRQKLGLEFCNTRYEDLVTDFDDECRRLCGFCGLQWDDAMRDFAARAREGLINTPSAPQVARGLFSQGIDQWRRYRNELAPVLPMLKPWAVRFGYPED